MLERVVVVAVILTAAYWYWSGPYQQRVNPDYATILEQNKQEMARCERGAAYQLGATGRGQSAEGARQNCAEKLNLYQDEDGQWHSYDKSRPEN